MASRNQTTLAIGGTLTGVGRAPLFVAFLALSQLVGRGIPKNLVMSDIAVGMVRARDIPTHIPVTGNFGRFGWAHPGPFYFFLYSIPAKLGSNPPVIALFTVAYKLILILLCAWFAERCLGVLGGVIVGSTILISNFNVPDSIWSPWNPYAALPFYSCLLCVVAFGSDMRHRPAVVVLLSSACIQMHVGYIVPVVLAIVVLVIDSLLRSKRVIRRDAFSAIIEISVVSAVLWALPLWDQVRGTGNMGRIIRYILNSDNVTMGLREAFRLSAYHLGLTGAWVESSGGHETIGIQVAPMWHLAIPIVSVCVISMVSFRREMRLRPLSLILWTQLFAFVFGLSRLEGYPGAYLYLWGRVIVGIVFGVIIWQALRSIVSRFILLRRSSTIQIACNCLAVLAISFQTIVRTEPVVSGAARQGAIDEFVTRAESLLTPGESVGVSIRDYLIGVTDALILRLEIDGHPVRLIANSVGSKDSLVMRYGSHRLAGVPVRLELTVAGEGGDSQWLGEGGLLVGRYDISSDQVLADTEWREVTLLVRPIDGVP